MDEDLHDRDSKKIFILKTYKRRGKKFTGRLGMIAAHVRGGTPSNNEAGNEALTFYAATLLLCCRFATHMKES